jgi:hypothetical protein
MVRTCLIRFILALAMQAGPANAASAQEAKVRYERDVITRLEIQERARDARTAYDVVRKLRPHFLRERSSGTVSGPATAEGNRSTPAARSPVWVYINGAKSNLPTVSLREITADAVIDMVYLNAADATTRFGTGHDNGAILVRIGA